MSDTEDISEAGQSVSSGAGPGDIEQRFIEKLAKVELKARAAQADITLPEGFTD